VSYWVERDPVSGKGDQNEYHSTRCNGPAADWSIAHMAIQRQLGLLSERRTRLSAAYSADIGFNGSAFLSVGAGAHSGHVEWGP
jgi:hypothetical protein